jgi:hypothetical protein
VALIGCFFRAVFTVVALVIIAAVGWLQRDRLREFWNDLRGVQTTTAAAPAVTAEVADRAQAKLDALSEGGEARTALSEAELQSLLTYRYEQLLPAFIDSARVELDGDRLRLRARVPAERLPRVEELGEAAELLPDMTELTVRGQLLPLDSGRIAFAIDHVTAARIPLPRRVVPAVLERLGRRDEPGLPRDAVALPLPPGVGGAYVRGDSLVLLARPASNELRN